MAIGKVIIGGAAAAGVLGLRRVAHSSGVTAAEIALSLPGDGLLPDATVTIDRATTLPAPPAQVWPWIVQLGKGRAGWYFPAWLDALTPPARRGLRTIDPALQAVQVGDVHPDWGPGDPVLRIARLEPEHALVYHSLRDTAAGHRWPAADDGEGVFAMSWALILTPVGEHDSRLHLRLRVRAKSALLAGLGGVFDWATVELLFAGLRERVAT